MSWGPNNENLTLVIELGDIPGQQLARVLVNDEWLVLGTVPHPEGFGLPATGKFAGFVWVRYYDGTQTAADPMLLSKYSAYPERPWSADMVGTGICYAIVTVYFNRSLFTSIPRVRFEMDGIPLYDPRRDSSVGGSGPHRFDNPATWQPSRNPMVQVYNIHRGLRLPGGHVWGFRNAASALPLDSVFAAANACDALVPAIGGGTEPAYRSDYEVFCSDEPMSICEEIFKSCMGQAAEVGGVWRFRVGAPSLPLASVTDDDVIVTQGQTFAPFKGLAQTYNGVHAAHPLPEALYQAVDAPPVYNAAWEIEDGNRRQIADLQLPTVTGSAQAQRLMLAYIREERRQRRHSATLPPDYAALEPFDVLSITMAQHGYVGKMFEIDQVAHDVRAGMAQVSVIERDPSDYTPPAVLIAPGVPSAVSIPQSAVVEGFAALPYTLFDAGGVARRPAIRLTWSGAAMESVRGITYEVRLASSGAMAAQGAVQRPQDGEVIVGGLVPGAAYQARARAVSDRASAWTPWLPVTAPLVRLNRSDLQMGNILPRLGTAGWVNSATAVPVGGSVGIGSLSVIDANGPIGLQHAYAAVRVTLSAPAARWVELQLEVGSAVVRQMLLILPGSGEYNVSAQVDTAAVVSLIELIVKSANLVAGDTLTVTQFRFQTVAYLS